MSEKVVIIGSGLGGLSCGYILQKNGYDVTVLEQGVQIGGCLQCFTRRGAKFETGMHFIGSAAPGQTLHRMMNYLDLSSIALSELDKQAYNTVHLDGTDFKFANGREAFIEQMASYFPKQKDALAAYMDIVEHVASESNLNSLTSDVRNMTAVAQYQTLSVNAVLDELFTDPLLKNVLAGDLPLYAGERDKTPFSQHAFIMDFYNRSAFRVAGGSDIMAQTLAENLQQRGGRILTQKKAVRVICDERRATGVETEDGCMYPADYLIGTVHPKRLLEMLDTKLIRPSFRARINRIPQTASVFALYVKFKAETMPYMNTNYFGYKGSDPWGCEDYTAETWPKGFLYMHTCHRDKAKWAQSAVVLSYMKPEEVALWKDTTVGQRGEDYENFKRAHALKLIQSVERQIKGFAESLEAFYTSTPLTYRDYTGTEDGSMYGVAKDIHTGAAGRVPYKTKIPNLFLAGQNVNSHGILGVMVGTIVTCSELVGAEKIRQQIERADK